MSKFELIKFRIFRLLVKLSIFRLRCICLNYFSFDSEVILVRNLDFRILKCLKN